MEEFNNWEYVTGRIAGIRDKVDTLTEKVTELKAIIKPKDELWDNYELMQNWKISERTLATWRSKGLIGFVQVGSKIWYPRESRELFLSINFNKTKERENDGEED